MPWLDEELSEADLLADPRSLDEHPMTKLPDSTMAVTIDLVFFIHPSFCVLRLVAPATENNARSRPRD
jgi:hypothetical protein